MGGLWSYLPSFKKKPPGTPVQGFVPRIKNIIKFHYKGLLGVPVAVLIIILMFKMHENDKKVELLYWVLLWFFIMQPVYIAVSCMIPIFYMPMLGIMKSDLLVKNFMNENIQLLILGSALVLLLNNSGADRRIALWFICSGSECQYSAKRLVFKFSTAAFFLSMFSNRRIASSLLIEYAVPPLVNLQAATSKYRASEPDYDKLRDILVSSIHTSCSIGSTAIFHSSPTTITMKAVFTEYPGDKNMFPDCFNYLQYSVFAFPTAFVLHCLNIGYHMILVNCTCKKPMSANSMGQLRTAYLQNKTKIPKRMTLHEKYSIIFSILYLLTFMLRWSPYLNMGWASFSANIAGGSKDVPAVKDTTVAALFLLMLHILPKSFNFLKVLGANTRSEMPPLKMESAILWWRFVDKNVIYAYLFFIGCSITMAHTTRDTGLGFTIKDNLGKVFTGKSLNVGLFLVCLVSTILSNVITGMGACVIFLPFVLSMTGNEGPAAKLRFRRDEGEGEGGGKQPDSSTDIWSPKQYLVCLIVGYIGCLSFMAPYVNCPSFFAKSAGKMKRMTIAKYGFGSAIISLFVIWVAVMFWAPIVWDPDGKGINIVPEPPDGPSSATTTSTAAPAAPPPPAEEF